jgi:hypothetical protein
LTSTFIKIISINIQPKKKIADANVYLPLAPPSILVTGMIRIRFIYLYCLVIVVDNDLGLASPFLHKFIAFGLISYPISILHYTETVASIGKSPA